jgi:hypothetical protein
LEKQNSYLRLGAVAHASKPSPQKVETGNIVVPGQLGKKIVRPQSQPKTGNTGICLTYHTWEAEVGE